MSGAALAGRRVVVTRAQHQSRELSQALERVGAEVIELPTIEIRPVEDLSELDRLLAGLARYALVVLGSKNAAEIFFRRLRDQGLVLEAPVACVGAKTKAYVEGAAWIREVAPGPVLAPDVHRAEALAELALARIRVDGAGPGARVLFPRAAEGRETLIDGLVAAGIGVDAPAIYRIAPAPRASREVVERLASADVFTFLSGETLRAFLEVVGETEARALLARAVVALIGPVAKGRADALGIRVDLVPESATVEALVAALDVRFMAARRVAPADRDV